MLFAQICTNTVNMLTFLHNPAEAHTSPWPLVSLSVCVTHRPAALNRSKKGKSSDSDLTMYYDLTPCTLLHIRYIRTCRQRPGPLQINTATPFQWVIRDDGLYLYEFTLFFMEILHCVPVMKCKEHVLRFLVVQQILYAHL